MISGEELRAVREAAHLGLREMARRAYFSAAYLSMVETGQREVTSEVLVAYERVLGIELRGEPSVLRRNFLRLLGAAGTNVQISSELAASIAGNDPGPLATIQTSHGVDLTLAALVDQGAVRLLHRWMQDEPNPVLRVNATGILAKLASQSPAKSIVEVLSRDDDVRTRYMAAVLTRVCGIGWTTASRIVGGQQDFPEPRAAAQLLSREVTDSPDVGARWCAATMLRQLAPALGEGRS
jgi:transcriptional regulator with XRE-family HTH domain